MLPLVFLVGRRGLLFFCNSIFRGLFSFKKEILAFFKNMAYIPSDFKQITPDSWIAHEKVYKEQLLQMPSWVQIPLINSNPTHILQDATLVRFRGMIQDMHNPEFYLESFETCNSSTKEVKVKSGKYRDTSDVGEDEQVNYTSNLKSGQRQTFVVVSIPALNEWVQTLENKENKLDMMNKTNTLEKPAKSETKRTMDVVKQEDKAIDEPMDVNEMESNKTAKVAEQNETENNGFSLSREHILNFPIPDVPSKSCLVKLYDEDINLKINDMVEVVGFLSINPSLSGEFAKNTNSVLPESGETEAELLTHNPPPSLVPRLHAVHVKRLSHCNPLVKTDANQAMMLKSVEGARENLQKTLTQLLFGDELAAEYLMLHLISYVCDRKDTITLGHLPLNLSNIPVDKCPDFTKHLYDFLRNFVTKSYYLPLTLENLNTMAFMPKKDYECNRLTSGLLQLSTKTHLVLDETKMEQGRLDASGLNNLKSLGYLIESQSVEYDFKYYQMHYDADVPVLVLSEGNSLLTGALQLPIKVDPKSLEIFKEVVEAAWHFLKPDVLTAIRTYLTIVREIEYSLSEDIQFVTDDFVQMRQNSEERASEADLHRLLVLARLVSVSRGCPTLNKECWTIAKSMETQRAHRVKSRNNL